MHKLFAASLALALAAPLSAPAQTPTDIKPTAAAAGANAFKSEI